MVVISINVTVPSVISVDEGVYVMFNDVLEGEYVPDPPCQMPVVTPVTDPFNVMEGLLAHTIPSGPAFAVIGAVNAVTLILAVVPGQVDESCIATE